jgi:hypothetical protein
VASTFRGLDREAAVAVGRSRIGEGTAMIPAGNGAAVEVAGRSAGNNVIVPIGGAGAGF